LEELDNFMNKASKALGENVHYAFDHVVIKDGADALVWILVIALRYEEVRKAQKKDVLDIKQSKYYEV
jgi:hypothetical protein